MLEPTPSTSPHPDRSAAEWDTLTRRLGRFYDVQGARNAGLSPVEVEEEGNLIAKEWNDKAGNLYNIKGAWDAGLGLNEIADEINQAYEAKKYGTIKPAEEPSTWQNIKNAWRAANPGADPLMVADQGTAGKLLSTIMTPLNIAASGAQAGTEGATEYGKQAAEQIGKHVPQGGPEIPVPVGFKGEFPFVKTEPAELGETAAAAAGTAVAEGLDPSNWLGPGAGQLAKTSSFAAKRAALGAYKDAKKAGLIRRMFNPKPGTVYHQFDPRGIADVSQGLTVLGRNIGSPIAGFMKGVKEGKSGKTFDELKDALKAVDKTPQTIDDLGKETRVQQIAEISGKEKALAGEAAQVAEREDRRAIELLKRNEGLTEAEAKLKIEASRAPEEVKLMKPWEKLAEEAAEKKKSPIDEVAENGEMMEDAANAYKLGEIETATPDEVFTVGRKGEPAPLREESRTFQKYWNDPDNSIFNSVKYFVGHILADPSAVIPKIAHEAGRLFDKLNETKQIFYKGVNEAVAGLDNIQKTAVAVMLDTKPEDWAPLAKYTNDPKIGLAYQRLRHLLDKLADVEGLSRKERLGDYFPHIFDNEKQWKGAKRLVDTETATAAKVVPAKSWMPRETADETGKMISLIKNKSGLGEVFDLENALAIRINAGLRKAYFNPMLKVWEPRIAGLTEGGRAYADAYTNKLLGRPGETWQKIEKALSKVKIGGKTYSIYDLNRWQLAVTMNYYRGLLGLALDTAFKNLGQIQNTITELGFRNTGRGLGRIFGEMFLTPKSRRIFKKAGIMEDYETIVTGAADILGRGKTWSAIDKVLFSPMCFSEYLNRGTAFHAGLVTAYQRGLKGKAAVEFAKQMVDKTQFRYGVTNTSPYLQNPFGKLWYQFGSYPMKETEFINDIIKDPDKKKLFRMLLFHGMVYGGAKATGAGLMDAMGYTEVVLPWTGNKTTGKKKKSIMLPTGIFPHLGIYTAPTLRTAASGTEAAGELFYKGEPGGKAQDFINNMANMLPARRYLEKVYQAQQKLKYGTDNRVPRFQEHAVNILKGKGMKKRKFGGAGALPYAGPDFIREIMSVRPRVRKDVEPLL